MSKVWEAEWWSAAVVALKKKVLLSVSERYSALLSVTPRLDRPFPSRVGVHCLACRREEISANWCKAVQFSANY